VTGVVEETPAPMAMTNVSSPFKGDWPFVISTFAGSPNYPITVKIYI
jgi:hypothetical protein